MVKQKKTGYKKEATDWILQLNHTGTASAFPRWHSRLTVQRQMLLCGLGTACLRLWLVQISAFMFVVWVDILVKAIALSDILVKAIACNVCDFVFV